MRARDKIGDRNSGQKWAITPGRFARFIVHVVQKAKRNKPNSSAYRCITLCVLYRSTTFSKAAIYTIRTSGFIRRIIYIYIRYIRVRTSGYNDDRIQRTGEFYALRFIGTFKMSRTCIPRINGVKRKRISESSSFVNLLD